jgi:hypothetical protein
MNPWERERRQAREQLRRARRRLDERRYQPRDVKTLGDHLVMPIPSCQRVRLKLADELRRLTHE